MREITQVIAARIDPAASALRCQAALRSRDVRIIDLDGGMSRLLADLPAPVAHAIMDRLSHYSRTIADADEQERHAVDAAADEERDATKQADAGRTLSEIRADVLADLLLTSTPKAHVDAAGNAMTGIRGEVNVTIPITTAAGIDRQPALLTGYGPVDADLVRELMAAAPGWNRVVIDVSTGASVGVDRYTPSTELRRYVDVRDERCRFPGCTMKPWRCDTDHTLDAALGGLTCAENLAHLCRRHHVLNTQRPGRSSSSTAGA